MTGPLAETENTGMIVVDIVVENTEGYGIVADMTIVGCRIDNRMAGIAVVGVGVGSTVVAAVEKVGEGEVDPVSEQDDIGPHADFGVHVPGREKIERESMK